MLLADHVRSLAIPTQAVRTAALRQLVLQAPAPVVADALGFHDKTTTRIAADAGGSCSHYASGSPRPMTIEAVDGLPSCNGSCRLLHAGGSTAERRFAVAEAGNLRIELGHPDE